MYDDRVPYRIRTQKLSAETSAGERETGERRAVKNEKTAQKGEAR